MSDTATDDQLNTIRSIMKDIRTVMLTTVSEDGSLHSHPMTTQQAEFDGDCWFIASDEADSVRQLTANPQVNLAYAGTSSWLSLAGRAETVRDEAKKKQLWNTFADAWFEQGVDDPKVILIHVTADSAQYWSTPGRLATVVSMLKTKVTGGTTDVGESEEVDLPSTTPAPSAD
jgi:general stress protein 26